MDDTKNQALIKAVAVFAVVPLLYVLSVGPCVRWYSPPLSMAFGRGALPHAAKTFYRPLFWAMDHCKPFNIVVEDYIDACVRWLPLP